MRNQADTANVLVDTDMAMPGEGVKLRVSLGRPIALADGDRFAVREGGRTGPANTSSLSPAPRRDGFVGAQLPLSLLAIQLAQNSL